jgi:hypothetical protein
MAGQIRMRRFMVYLMAAFAADFWHSQDIQGFADGS